MRTASAIIPLHFLSFLIPRTFSVYNRTPTNVVIMVHLNPDGKISLGSGIAFSALAFISVGLRLLAKLYTKSAWASDDSWAVMSLIALFAWLGVEFWGM